MSNSLFGKTNQQHHSANQCSLKRLSRPLSAPLPQTWGPAITQGVSPSQSCGAALCSPLAKWLASKPLVPALGQKQLLSLRKQTVQKAGSLALVL